MDFNDLLVHEGHLWFDDSIFTCIDLAQDIGNGNEEGMVKGKACYYRKII